MKGKILIFFDFFILGAMRQGVEEKAFSVLWLGVGFGENKKLPALFKLLWQFFI